MPTPTEEEASALPEETETVPLNDDVEAGEGAFQPLRRMFSEASVSVVSQGELRQLTCGGFVGAVANLCSATLGAGILALPYAFFQAGMLCGLLLLLASAWGTAASIRLLVQACDIYRLGTYETVVEKVLGTRWRQVVEISILIFCAGTAVAYVIAVGDILERVQDLSPTYKKLAMAVVWVFAMFPLSCLRRMQSLQCASSVGILSIGTLLLAATVHLIFPPANEDDDNLGSHDLMTYLFPAQGVVSVIRACPIVFFAFSCQCNVCQIYSELPGPRGVPPASDEPSRLRNMAWVTGMGVALCSLLYTSVSTVTLMDFGGDMLPNFLSCYQLRGSDQPLLHIAFVAMALAVVLAFPLNIFPARVAIIQMWESSVAKHTAEQLLACTANEEARKPLLSEGNSEDYQSSGSGEMDRGHCDPLRQPPTSTPSLLPRESALTEGTLDPDDDDDLPEFHAPQHFLVTVLVAGFALGLALVVPNISIVFGLLGGTTSSILGFIVPGLLGLEMDRSNVSAWILVVAGTLVGILSTCVTLYATIRDNV